MNFLQEVLTIENLHIMCFSNEYPTIYNVKVNPDK